MISLRITLDTGDPVDHATAGHAGDGWAQALKDLEHAKNSHDDGGHEWACFAAQQAAEKAVKALYLYLGYEGKGNLVAKLITDAPGVELRDPQMISWAMVLDTYYIPTRYPDSHAEGAPFERYGSLQSEEAVFFAGKILEFIHEEVIGNRAQ